MKASQHLLFIHIPKTAGTSFRIAAEEYFGKENTFYDYSPKSTETSKEVLSTIYDANDPYKLYRLLSKQRHSFFAGHFHASKYAPLYETLNVISFVRDPVEQVISHYNHFKTYHKYEKDLADFIREPRFRNLQSKYLVGKHIALYGFLGLTEEYSKSIDIFNSLYGTRLLHKHINTRETGSLGVEDVDEEILENIKKINARDIELYNSVKQQFYIRQKLFDKNLPFTYGIIQKIAKNQISGLAFQKESDEAVEVDIYLDHTYLATVMAHTLRAGQVQKNVPRKGFIGFDYIHKGSGDLNGKLRAFVKRTGQEILQW